MVNTGQSVSPAITHRRRVAVVIVHYNQPSQTVACLRAVQRQSASPDRVLLVDNSEQPWALPAWCAVGVERMTMDQNVGFAAGVNRAISAAIDCEWIAILNPDVTPEPDWIAELLRSAEENPAYSFFATQLLQADRKTHVDGEGDVYHHSGLAWRRGHGQPRHARHACQREVFSACGAAAFYSRQALLDVGGFDEHFFCYFEDVEIGFRLRLLGHRCLYEPRAVAFHIGSGCTGKRSDFSVFYGHRNMVWTFWKNMPSGQLWCNLPAHVLINVCALAYFTGRGQGRVIVRSKCAALRGLRRVWQQRKQVQRKRRVTQNAISQAMTTSWRAVFWRGCR